MFYGYVYCFPYTHKKRSRISPASFLLGVTCTMRRLCTMDADALRGGYSSGLPLKRMFFVCLSVFSALAGVRVQALKVTSST